MDGQEPGTEGEKQMNRWIVGIFAMVLGTLPMAAQSIEDLNIQIHGYATQGFVYSTQNNWNSMTSSNGSPAWTEAVVNVTTQPEPKLRVGVQARYFLLGNYGNAIALDWADADYKVNEKFGSKTSIQPISGRFCPRASTRWQPEPRFFLITEGSSTARSVFRRKQVRWTTGFGTASALSLQTIRFSCPSRPMEFSFRAAKAAICMAERCNGIRRYKV
jgi:hypothetical protein